MDFLTIQSDCNYCDRIIFALGSLMNPVELFNSVGSVRERTTPTERPPLVGEDSANFMDRGCHVVMADTFACGPLVVVAVNREA
jgi:hypothetical protein